MRQRPFERCHSLDLESRGISNYRNTYLLARRNPVVRVGEVVEQFAESATASGSLSGDESGRGSLKNVRKYPLDRDPAV